MVCSPCVLPLNRRMFQKRRNLCSLEQCNCTVITNFLPSERVCRLYRNQEVYITLHRIASSTYAINSLHRSRCSQHSFEPLPTCISLKRNAALSLSAVATCSDTDRGLLTSIDHDMNNEWIHAA